MLKIFEMMGLIQAQHLAKLQQHFEQRTQAQIDYVTDGPQYIDIQHPTVYRTDDTNFDMNRYRSNQTRTVQHVSNQQFKVLVQFWMAYYTNHPILYRQQLKRSQCLYQYYQNHHYSS